MKKFFALLFVIVCLVSCKGKEKSLAFSALQPNAFNHPSFKMNMVKELDSNKHSHDSCMGFSFDANVFLPASKKGYFIGSVVNKQSLQTINNISDLGLPLSELTRRFNILTNPCYEKVQLNLPLRLILGDSFNLHFDTVSTALNKEINDMITASENTQIESGSWVYLDVRGALQSLLDSTNNPQLLQYKKNLLDTANMVLTAAESLTDINFVITTHKDISDSLQSFLQTRPTIPQRGPQGASIRLSPISFNKFQMTLNGLFPMSGEFMQATWQ